MSGPHTVFFADENNVRFNNELTTVNAGETKVLHLRAEIPDTKTLKAFHFTLPYDASKIEVLKIEKSADSIFDTTINESTPGTISVNGFNTTGELGVEPVKTVTLLDITVKGVAEGNSVFGITVNNFGTNDTPVEEFIPATVPLNITVNPAASLGNRAFWSYDAVNSVDVAETEMTVGDTKVIRLTADVPEGKTLKAFKFTLPYSSGIVDVVNAVASATSVFTTTINKTANSIVVNGFFANGIAGAAGKTVDLLDVTVKAVAEGTTAFGITANDFGDNENNEFIPETFPLTINVQPIVTNKAFWTDATTDLRFADDKLEIAVDHTQVIRLATEIPADKTLRAYKFTLTYDPTAIEVIDIGNLAFENTTINDIEPGKIVFNGFDTTGTEGGANGFILSLLDVGIKGLAAGATANFTIQADKFGDIDSPTEEFLPTEYPLAITVKDTAAGAAYFANTSNVKLDPYQVILATVNAEQTIRLMAEVPAGKTLKAYKFTLVYDKTVVEITGEKALFTFQRLVYI